jgi:hypothetical protein
MFQSSGSLFTSKTTVPVFPPFDGKAAPIDEFVASWRVNSGIALKMQQSGPKFFSL